MLTIQIDRLGSYKIRWPRTDDDIITLTEAWIAYESSRAANSQLKDYTPARLQISLDAAKTARANAHTGEASRAVASDDFRTLLATAKNHLTFALNLLKYKHAENLYQLEFWGWNVRQTAKGTLSVRMPTKDAEIIALLATYVAYESTRGAAQLTEPPLATLQNLLVDLQDLAQNRGSSRVQRTANIYDRSTATSDLLNYLQGAAYTLCLLEFDGKVHPNLANWGYMIVEATSPKGEEDGASAGDPVA